MFYEYKSLLTNAGDNRKNDLKQNDMFYVKLARTFFSLSWYDYTYSVLIVLAKLNSAHES